MAEPIDTSKLGPIRIDAASPRWSSSKRCAAELHLLVKTAKLDPTGTVPMHHSTLSELAAIMDRYPLDRVEFEGAVWQRA